MHLGNYIFLKLFHISIGYKCHFWCLYFCNIHATSPVTEDFSCPFCLVKCASYKVDLALTSFSIIYSNFTYSTCIAVIACDCFLNVSDVFQGLRFHLTASHDLFHYEFWVSTSSKLLSLFLTESNHNYNTITVMQVTEDYQVVIVSMKTDTCSSEVSIWLSCR